MKITKVTKLKPETTARLKSLKQEYVTAKDKYSAMCLEALREAGMEQSVGQFSDGFEYVIAVEK